MQLHWIKEEFDLWGIYATLHKEQHNIMESFNEYGYTGIDQRAKVRYFSEGIKTTRLDSVKTRIMSDESVRQYFDRCVMLYNVFVKQSSADNRQSSGIAESSTNNASGNKIVTFSHEDRYYD